MPFRFNIHEQLTLLRTLAKWSLLGSLVGILSGAASFLFLKSLEWATRTQQLHPNLLLLLPVAGVGISLLYTYFGKKVEGGNNLILEQIHDPKQTIPFRMAPLIFVTTVATHLFGGSAGREGTAVQMGGTLADILVKPFKLTSQDRQMLLMAGISGGFGSVFGTPLAGTIFGLEVLAIGRFRVQSLVPCMFASIVGDVVCQQLGVIHFDYHPLITEVPRLSPLVYGLFLLAGLCFGLTSLLFSELTHTVQHYAKNWCKTAWGRPVIGGVILIALTLLVGNRDYNGLGLELIQKSFSVKLLLAAFALKLLFTAITLGAGFKGGEVTPLFCIGACLGNAFGQVTHQPIAIFAALGFVAVFAGAANTPIACIVMGIELFGSQLAVPLLICCVVAYIASGHSGIYGSQRIRHAKTADKLHEGSTLRQLRENHSNKAD